MKVLISVTRKVQYASIVEMSKEEYEKLQASCESKNRIERRMAETKLNGMIKVNDWQGDELHSLDGFEIFQY